MADVTDDMVSEANAALYKIDHWTASYNGMKAALSTALRQAPSPMVTEEEIARAICCGAECFRPDDCWKRNERYAPRQKVRAVLALLRERQQADAIVPHECKE